MATEDQSALLARCSPLVQSPVAEPSLEALADPTDGHVSRQDVVMRILVTNDDGIDSVGLHVLARAMREHGDVTVVAPDREYSGASAAFGAIHIMRPDVHKAHIDGMDEVWALSGPPALCVMMAHLGLFDKKFDLVVSGINPGANVGRSVYHSGTIGATLTGRNYGMSGVAVSQAVNGFSVEGQGWDEMVKGQIWETAATVASHAVAGLIAAPHAEPVVININVPNLPLDEIKGWRRTRVGHEPPRAMVSARMEPKEGHTSSFDIKMSWGDPLPLPIDTDGGAVEAGEVSVTFLSKLQHHDIEHTSGAEESLSRLLQR
jgi:5'-nucleotidase